MEVGKVKKVEAVDEGRQGAARVTMEIKEEGLPIQRDAELKVRPRIFLEGNFFVDLEPGLALGARAGRGRHDPGPQTAAPVQFGDVLTALQRDTRADLQTFLREYSEGLAGGGAGASTSRSRYWEPAYRNSALANDATLGHRPRPRPAAGARGPAAHVRGAGRGRGRAEGPRHQLQRHRGRARARGRGAGRLDPGAARHAAGRPARRWPRSTPRCRRCARSPRRAARRALLGRDAGRRAALHPPGAPADVRARAARHGARPAPTIPDVVGFNRGSVPFLEQARALSACTNDVLVPFAELEVPNPDEPENNGQKVRRAAPARLRGPLRREPPLRRQQPVLPRRRGPARQRVRPGPPPDGGSMPPPHRPDVPCETQELPNLHAPGGPIAKFPVLEQSGGTTQRALRRPERGQFLGAVRTFAEGGLARHREGARGVQRARGSRQRCARRARHEDARSARTWRDFLAVIGVVVLGLGDRRLHPVQPAAALPADRGEAVRR